MVICILYFLHFALSIDESTSKTLDASIVKFTPLIVSVDSSSCELTLNLTLIMEEEKSIIIGTVKDPSYYSEKVRSLLKLNSTNMPIQDDGKFLSPVNTYKNISIMKIAQRREEFLDTSQLCKKKKVMHCSFTQSLPVELLFFCLCNKLLHTLSIFYKQLTFQLRLKIA